mgnify:CR=1 FL=1
MTRLLASLFALGVVANFPDAPHAAEGTASAVHDEFGRLFLEPRQRVSRNALGARPSGNPISTAPSHDSQTAETPEHFHLNGIAIDGRGRMTLWVNGARYEPGKTMTIAALNAPGRVRVTLADRATPIEVGVGQRVELASLRVVEGFEAGVPDMLAEMPPVPSARATTSSPHAKRTSTRTPALHLHVHTAKPLPRRKSAKHEDD